MINSELLDEKYRIQKKLSQESASAHEYLKKSHQAAKEIAKKYGLSLKYVKMTNKPDHSRKVFKQVLILSK